MKRLALIIVCVTGLLLIYAGRDFPAWADANSPANSSEISRHYITETETETAVPNFVTAVLADYRGFDTLFETVVIFTAGLAIISILGLNPSSRRALGQPDARSDRDLIVVMTCRLIVPVIQLFALYVVAHGHHSPGGGFQGGVIFGASLILIAVTHDLPTALLRLSEKRAVILAVIGIVIYGGIGFLCVLFKGNYLDYGVLHSILPATDSIMARSHGMLGVEIGVAFTVASVMFAIYANLSSRGNLKGGL